jgi:hypothetical protein
MISIALTFMDEGFAPLVFKHILKELITEEEFLEKKKEVKWEFV